MGTNRNTYQTVLTVFWVENAGFQLSASIMSNMIFVFFSWSAFFENTWRFYPHSRIQSFLCIMITICVVSLSFSLARHRWVFRLISSSLVLLLLFSVPPSISSWVFQNFLFWISVNIVGCLADSILCAPILYYNARAINCYCRCNKHSSTIQAIMNNQHRKQSATTHSTYSL